MPAYSVTILSAEQPAKLTRDELIQFASWIDLLIHADYAHARMASSWIIKRALKHGVSGREIVGVDNSRCETARAWKVFGRVVEGRFPDSDQKALYALMAGVRHRDFTATLERIEDELAELETQSKLLNKR